MWFPWRPRAPHFVRISGQPTNPATAEEAQSLATNDSPPKEIAVTEVPDELAKVCDWRIDSLMAAGYPAWVAVQLALNRNVDLHQAEKLLSAGCSVELAFEVPA